MVELLDFLTTVQYDIIETDDNVSTPIAGSSSGQFDLMKTQPSYVISFYNILYGREKVQQFYHIVLVLLPRHHVSQKT